MSNYSTHEVLNATLPAQKALPTAKTRSTASMCSPCPMATPARTCRSPCKWSSTTLRSFDWRFRAEIRKTITRVRSGALAAIPALLRRRFCAACAKASKASKKRALPPRLLIPCFARATEVAFQAVRKPVEGHHSYRNQRYRGRREEGSQKKVSTEEALDFIVNGAYESVQRTPEFLPVLEENGVVDAGGFSLAISSTALAGNPHGQGGLAGDALATLVLPEGGNRADRRLGCRFRVPLLHRIPRAFQYD